MILRRIAAHFIGLACDLAQSRAQLAGLTMEERAGGSGGAAAKRLFLDVRSVKVCVFAEAYR